MPKGDETLITAPGLRSRKRWLSENWRFLVLGILGILLIWCAHKFTSDQHQIPTIDALNSYPPVKWVVTQIFEICEKLGDAVIIAALLGLLVDPLVKIKLFDEVLKYTGLNVWIRHLPDSLRQEMVKLTQVNLVRECWDVSYKLTAEGKLMRVESTSSGDIRNVGQRDEKFNFFVSVDPSMIQGAPEPEIRKIELRYKNEAPFFSKAPVVSQTEDGTRRSEDIPVQIPHGEYLSTLYELFEMRPLNFISPLFISIAVAKTVLKIEYDTATLDVHVSTGLSEDLPPEKPTKDLPAVKGQLWVIKEPLLPGHGLQIRWSPKLTQNV